MSDQIEELTRQLDAKDKTIRVLSERLERGISDDISSFALFEQNISMESIVAKRTSEIEKQRTSLNEALTELKAAQAELLQAQKMQAIGQLAAGIAHEINTPIQFISNNISFLADSFDELLHTLRQVQVSIDEAPCKRSIEDCRRTISDVINQADLEYLNENIPKALNECEEGILRISGIVSAMKEFAHPSGGKLQSVDLNPLILSTVEISRSEWKYVADLEADLDASLPGVKGLKDELGQVLLNLIVNAAHAITDSNLDGDRKGLIRIKTRRSQNWAEILVEDTGCGIPEELQQKIFEPFFTTKEVGRGSGQGLAISYNVVVDKHHGELLLKSECGKGTTFIVRLPIEYTV
jgi:two-component system, NtrC family, sensor kinase